MCVNSLFDEIHIKAMTAYHKLKGTNAQRTATNGVAVFIVYPFILVYLFHGCFSYDTRSINSYFMILEIKTNPGQYKLK